MDWSDVIGVTLGCAGFFGVPMLYIWAKHKQRLAELQSRFTPIDSASLNEFKRLQDEVARLRDTTTQYDMTVEHKLSEIAQRLATVESKTAVVSSAPSSHPQPSPQEDHIQQKIQR